MCGRGALTLSGDRCRRIAGGHGGRTALRGSDRLRKKYNLGPMNYVPVVRTLEGSGQEAALDREVCAMRWGLVPAFAKRAEDFDAFKGGSSTFNARVEGAESSNLWRRLLDKRRCVVLFDGFYEWKAHGKTKTPMFIRNRDEYDGHTIPWRSKTSEDLQKVGEPDEKELDGPQHAPLFLAGLYDVWHQKGDVEETLESVTILTMDPEHTIMEEVHDRMPVFLTPETAASWLDPSVPFSEIIRPVLKMSQAHAQSQLLLYEVSPLVSNIRNESPDCVLPKKKYDEKQLAKGIGRFFKPKPADSDLKSKKRTLEDCEEQDKEDVKVIRLE
ncbi:hmces [Symbiodinium pilosum]|uniref:Hmces protein n=1 Tax=Symbiodinium pilosum TaxID=2952 RepID=A0A812X3E1_SYMPI|nr:hmces [Symbiodinium pilosum]